MTFTGSELTVSRAFYTQTGAFGFGIGLTVNNTTGTYRFGVTGAQGSLEFRLHSGRLHYQDQFIHTYRSNEQVLIEAQFTSGRANVIRNGAALIYGDPKATGLFDTFYLSRANAGMGADFDLLISGQSVPTYTVTTRGYITSSGQAGVTGWFTNTSAYPIRVFDSSIQASDLYTFGKLAATIGPGASGAFTLSGAFDTFDLSQPVLTTFNTSFSDLTSLFYVVDAATDNRFVQLTAPTDLSFSPTDVLNRDVSWLNYSGGFAGATYPTDLVFRLTYATGTETFTGVWSMMTGVDSSSLVGMSFDTGMISGSGRFAANSSINWQVTYSGLLGDAARLIISGALVSNPINQLLSL